MPLLLMLLRLLRAPPRPRTLLVLLLRLLLFLLRAPPRPRALPLLLLLLKLCGGSSLALLPTGSSMPVRLALLLLLVWRGAPAAPARPCPCRAGTSRCVLLTAHLLPVAAAVPAWTPLL